MAPADGRDQAAYASAAFSHECVLDVAASLRKLRSYASKGAHASRPIVSASRRIRGSLRPLEQGDDHSCRLAPGAIGQFTRRLPDGPKVLGRPPGARRIWTPGADMRAVDYEPQARRSKLSTTEAAPPAAVRADWSGDPQRTGAPSRSSLTPLPAVALGDQYENIVPPPDRLKGRPGRPYRWPGRRIA